MERRTGTRLDGFDTGLSLSIRNATLQIQTNRLTVNRNLNQGLEHFPIAPTPCFHRPVKPGDESELRVRA
jgi:hypothetical protein